ncbi:MAG TPA: ATP-binding protein [Polyangiales bacterium]|nr:ATP-binding protein [Polyangiales bacterium]
MGKSEAEPERVRNASEELEVGERREPRRQGRESDIEPLRQGHAPAQPRPSRAERSSFQPQSRHQQRLEAIGTLASGVAHEINNPVQSIMNYALLIERRSDSPDVERYAQEILHEAQRVAAIVRGLLSFARQEGEPYTEVAVSELVSSTLSLISAMLRKEGIQVDISDLEDGPAVRCHPQQIQQVLMNLLSNARDALNERYSGAHDDKRIIVRSRSWRREGEVFVRLTIEDFGTGIPPGLLDQIFDPFRTTKAQGQSAGLGLSISHGIVVEHGGAISVESELGHFTRFHVDLPAPAPVPAPSRTLVREVVSR